MAYHPISLETREPPALSRRLIYVCMSSSRPKIFHVLTGTTAVCSKLRLLQEKDEN